MDRNILLKSLGWGILVAEVPYGLDGPDMSQDELMSALSESGLQGVTEILPDPSGSTTAVILTYEREPCQIEKDLMGEEEKALLDRLARSFVDSDLHRRMRLLGID